MITIQLYIQIKGITRKVAAKEFNVPYSTLCSWLQGKSTIPSAELKRITAYIRTRLSSIDVFFMPGWVSPATIEAIATILALEFTNLSCEDIRYYFPNRSKKMVYSEFLRLMSSLLPDEGGNKRKEVKRAKNKDK